MRCRPLAGQANCICDAHNPSRVCDHVFFAHIKQCTCLPLPQKLFKLISNTRQPATPNPLPHKHTTYSNSFTRSKCSRNSRMLTVCKCGPCSSQTLTKVCSEKTSTHPKHRQKQLRTQAGRATKRNAPSPPPVDPNTHRVCAGFLQLLAQLTTVGDVSKQQFEGMHIQPHCQCLISCCCCTT